MTTGTPPSTTEKSLNNEQISKNASSDISAMTDPSAAYDHRGAYVEIIKVVNNRYSNPVTLKFATVTKERTVNITQKYVVIFAAIKRLNPTATIKYTKIIVYHHPKDFHTVKHINTLLKSSSIRILTPNYTSTSNISSNPPSRSTK